MPRRTVGQMKDLPRGPGGSHRRAAQERAVPVPRRAQLWEKAAEEKFPALSLFRPGALWQWLKTYSAGVLQARPDFPAPTAQSIVAMPPSAKLAIAGDWGTGTDEAATIAAHMKKTDPHYTLHLGDVYYVGSQSYIDENCNNIRQPNGFDPVEWPHGEMGSFALNGNHEAYAGDGAYFQWIRSDLNQPSSCFLLHNDHWCVLGLDTGYNSRGIPWLGWVAEKYGWTWLMPSCKIPDPALAWLQAVAQPYLGSGRGLILLTHHQYFSSFDNEYPNAARQLAKIPGFAGRTLLWMWGHEHRLAGYDAYGEQGIRAFGRCLGHGGMPCDRGIAPLPKRRTRPLRFYDDRSYDPQNEVIVSTPTLFGVNGYALLTFQGASLTVSYRDITGAEIASESWSASQGGVALQAPTRFGATVALEGNKLVCAQQ